MNKKLILLMLALPLILMISLFTATKTVSLTVKVPVERIEIIEENVVYLDLDRGQTHEVNYTVYPINAANRAVNCTFEQVGNEPLATLEFDAETGVLTPKTCGKARVTLTTIDGGFSGNFIVQVDSKSLTAITASISSPIIDIGTTATISTAFTPKNAPNKQLRYEVVEGADIVSVNTQGVVKGLGVGEATIRVVSRFNESIYSDVQVAVTSSKAMQFSEKSVTNTMEQAGGSIPVFVQAGVAYEYNMEVLDVGGNATDAAIDYVFDEENKVFNYTFKENFVGTVTVRLTVNVEGVEPYVDTCIITRIRKIQAAWVGASSAVVKVGETLHINFAITPPGVEIDYRISYEHDEGYISVTENIAGGELIVTAEAAAEKFSDSYTYVVLEVWSTSNPGEVITLRYTVSVRK